MRALGNVAIAADAGRSAAVATDGAPETQRRIGGAASVVAILDLVDDIVPAMINRDEISYNVGLEKLLGKYTKQ